MVKCLVCGEEVPENESICKCGAVLSSINKNEESVESLPEDTKESMKTRNEKRCPKCNFPNPVDAKFCQECNTSLQVIAESEPMEKVNEKRCPKCNFPNPVDAKFCQECGTSLQVIAESEPMEKVNEKRCPKCNFPNPVDAKFCQECGTSLQVIAESKLPHVKTSSVSKPDFKLKLILPNNSEIPIISGIQIIGREHVLDVLSEDDALYVSREHIEVSLDDNSGRVFIEDISRNGTTLNGKEIKGEGKKEVFYGDKIVLARKVTLTVSR